MIITASRPYFAPYPGFFFQAYLADLFVILDTVQLPRKTTWITRNRFKNDQGTWWMTVPVHKKGLGLQNITDVRMVRQGRWSHKHLAGLKHAYANAPFFAEHLQFLEKLYVSFSDRLLDFNLAIIRHLMVNLGVDTEIRRLSELKIDAGGDRLLVEICRWFDASAYLAPAAAAKYLNAGLFKKAGIDIRVVNYRFPIYPQLWGDFIPGLTTLDLLFNCGPKARDIMMTA